MRVARGRPVRQGWATGGFAPSWRVVGARQGWIPGPPYDYTVLQLVRTFSPPPPWRPVPLADNSRKAYYKEFRRVVELSDVVIQVLDARDPLACRCVWVPV